MVQSRISFEFDQVDGKLIFMKELMNRSHLDCGFFYTKGPASVRSERRPSGPLLRTLSLRRRQAFGADGGWRLITRLANNMCPVFLCGSLLTHELFNKKIKIQLEILSKSMCPMFLCGSILKRNLFTMKRNFSFDAKPKSSLYFPYVTRVTFNRMMM